MLFGLGLPSSAFDFVTHYLDCENVWSCDFCLCHLLVALSHLLHVLLLQPLHHEGLVHTTHVPLLLLAGYGQHLCQSHSLLCHEQKVGRIDNSVEIWNKYFRFQDYFKQALCCITPATSGHTHCRECRRKYSFIFFEHSQHSLVRRDSHCGSFRRDSRHCGSFRRDSQHRSSRRVSQHSLFRRDSEHKKEKARNVTEVVIQNCSSNRRQFLEVPGSRKEHLGHQITVRETTFVLKGHVL